MQQYYAITFLIELNFFYGMQLKFTCTAHRTYESGNKWAYDCRNPLNVLERSSQVNFHAHVHLIECFKMVIGSYWINPFSYSYAVRAQLRAWL